MRFAQPPFEGRDLNPILQDIGLAVHPPLLYLGYVGFSISFAFAVAALIDGRIDAAWARWVRPWTLTAWMFLTLGIAMGSYWAYYELGWGGWWFWDPVENASLMPWIAGTALLHSAVVMEKRIAPGSRIRLGGLVKEGSLTRGDNLTVRFEVTDGNKTVPVSYTGILPDLFREGQGVVTEGTLDASGHFKADSVLAKHDETYMPKEVADALKKQGHWKSDGYGLAGTTNGGKK